MRIVFRQYDLKHLFGLICIFLHRSFYLQDKTGDWYCDACRKEIFQKLKIDLIGAFNKTGKEKK